MIIVNFKNYKKGKSVLRLVWGIEHVSKKIIIAVPDIEIERVAGRTESRVFAQHVDSFEGERGTGLITIEGLKKAGAKGSLLNHSEHRVGFEEIKEVLKVAEKKKFKVLIFVKSVTEAKKILKLKPWAIAYEDPKLVGGKKSITKYRTKTVEEFGKLFKGKKTIPLCGAGIQGREDYLKAKELGCNGVAIASGVVKSKRPEKVLKEMLGE
jgi:triosephosphate isomerase (TIM)